MYCTFLVICSWYNTFSPNCPLGVLRYNGIENLKMRYWHLVNNLHTVMIILFYLVIVTVFIRCSCSFCMLLYSYGYRLSVNSFAMNGVVRISYCSPTDRILHEHGILNIFAFVVLLHVEGGLVESKLIFTAPWHHLGWCMTLRVKPLTGPSSEHWPDWRERQMRVWRDTSTPLSTCVGQPANCLQGKKKVLCMIIHVFFLVLTALVWQSCSELSIWRNLPRISCFGS